MTALGFVLMWWASSYLYFISLILFFVYSIKVAQVSWAFFCFNLLWPISKDFPAVIYVKISRSKAFFILGSSSLTSVTLSMFLVPTWIDSLSNVTAGWNGSSGKEDLNYFTAELLFVELTWDTLEESILFGLFNLLRFILLLILFY